MPAILSHDACLAEPHRLAIVLEMAAAPSAGLGFVELGARLGLTEGNLACHLRRLQQAAYVAAQGNGGRGRASRTVYALTPAGRARLTGMREELEALAGRIADSLASEKPRAGVVRSAAGGAQRATEAVEVPVQVHSFVEERFSGPD